VRYHRGSLVHMPAGTVGSAIDLSHIIAGPAFTEVDERLIQVYPRETSRRDVKSRLIWVDFGHLRHLADRV
jgi:hypothetical protein